MHRNNGSIQRNQRKEWSILVYMAGGKDVSDEARSCLLQMKGIGLDGEVSPHCPIRLRK